MRERVRCLGAPPVAESPAAPFDMFARRSAPPPSLCSGAKKIPSLAAAGFARGEDFSSRRLEAGTGDCAEAAGAPQVRA